MKVYKWQDTALGNSWTCLVSVLVIILGPQRTMCGKQRELCNRAQNKCVSRVGCGMALHNYFLNCRALINRETDECTLDCQKAIISLLSTEDQEGANFMECDCNGNDFCLNHRKRMEICSRDVMQAMESVYDDETDISCSLAELICRADTSCYTALGYYERHCTKLFKGEKCSARCNNSLTILYRQAKARKLRTCMCDGTEEYPCAVIKQNTEKLCFEREHHRHRHRHRGNHTRSQTYDETIDGNNDNAIARQQKNKDRVSVSSSHSQSSSVHNCGQSVTFLFILFSIFSSLDIIPNINIVVDLFS